MSTSKNLALLHPGVYAAVEKYGLSADAMACNPELADTQAFCQAYGFAPEQTCNAIIVVAKADPVKYVCCVILSTCKLDVNKTVSRLIGIKRCSFASAEQTIETTSMQIGGVTPVGIIDLAIYVDDKVMNNERVVLGGGNRTSKLLMDPQELKKLPHLQIIEGLAIPRFETGC